MAGRSGVDGSVAIGSSTIAEVTGWTFEMTSNNPAWASSTTPGYKRRVRGVRDATGSFDFKWDAGDPLEQLINVGDSVTLLLNEDSSRQWSVPALIDSISAEVDMDDGEVIGGTCEFSANGQWTEA